jgi:hypothetical protein
MKDEKHDEILAQFREQLVNEDILHEGDTIGTDDDTLLYVLITLVVYCPSLRFKYAALTMQRRKSIEGFYVQGTSTWPRRRKCSRILRIGGRL